MMNFVIKGKLIFGFLQNLAFIFLLTAFSNFAIAETPAKDKTPPSAVKGEPAPTHPAEAAKRPIRSRQSVNERLLARRANRAQQLHVAQLVVATRAFKNNVLFYAVPTYDNATDKLIETKFPPGKVYFIPPRAETLSSTLMLEIPAEVTNFSVKIPPQKRTSQYTVLVDSGRPGSPAIIYRTSITINPNRSRDIAKIGVDVNSQPAATTRSDELPLLSISAASMGHEDVKNATVSKNLPVLGTTTLYIIPVNRRYSVEKITFNPGQTSSVHLKSGTYTVLAVNPNYAPWIGKTYVPNDEDPQPLFVGLIPADSVTVAAGSNPELIQGSVRHAPQPGVQPQPSSSPIVVTPGPQPGETVESSTPIAAMHPTSPVEATLPVATGSTPSQPAVGSGPSASQPVPVVNGTAPGQVTATVTATPGQVTISTSGGGPKGSTLPPIKVPPVLAPPVVPPAVMVKPGLTRVKLERDSLKGATYTINGAIVPETDILGKGVRLPSTKTVVIRVCAGSERADAVECKRGYLSEAVVDGTNPPAEVQILTPGKIRIVNINPVQASIHGPEVEIDGQFYSHNTSIPLEIEVGPGEHTVTVRRYGYKHYRTKVVVPPLDTHQVEVTFEEEPDYFMGDFSSAAFAKRFGSWNISMGAGFPYVFNAYGIVGLGPLIWLGNYAIPFDLGLGFRTTGYMHEIDVMAKFQLFRARALAGALETHIGGGGNGGLRNRGVVDFSIGPRFSLTVKRFNLSFFPHFSLSYYRPCSSVDSIQQLAAKGDSAGLISAATPESPTDVCTINNYSYVDPMDPTKTLTGVSNPVGAVGNVDPGKMQTNITPVPPYDPKNPAYQLNGAPVLGWFMSTQLVLEFNAEIKVTNRFGVRLTYQYVPNQTSNGPRYSNTNYFSPIFPGQDAGHRGSIDFVLSF